MYMLQCACSAQVRTLSMGRPLHKVSAAARASTEAMGASATTLSRYGQLAWPALLRMLDRRMPGYESRSQLVPSPCKSQERQVECLHRLNSAGMAEDRRLIGPRIFRKFLETFWENGMSRQATFHISARHCRRTGQSSSESSASRTTLANPCSTIFQVSKMMGRLACRSLTHCLHTRHWRTGDGPTKSTDLCDAARHW